MFNWLTHTAGSLWRRVSGEVSGFVHTVIGGVVALLTTLFGHVTGAWDDMERATHDLEIGAKLIGESMWHKFGELTGYWLPHLVYPAFWWVTHPDQLAEVLAWRIVAWLERNAVTATRYLGEFALHLVTRNLRQLLPLAETIVAAVL